ncbi:hypothetical protein HO133_007424 [Letharia lupina]|uniref:Uncharacterized protein n=1 Tax=Letharia lupina TaxID=560253 RepID=A0A8H6FIV4_9LECA|nr:uncharacterized protein HO133_007424 [Letharia lupina]KAF6229308.1 hypothetical protein HO133_007424 [Letharia lupina]
MDEKSAMEKRYGRKSPLPLYQKKHDSSFTAPSDISRLRSRPVVYITAIIFAFLIITYGLPVRLSTFNPQGSPETIRTQPAHAKSNRTGLVPLEAHVMSKCPDAKQCLEELVVPAMEQVVDMVNFRLSYIGSVDDNDTLHCMHGQTECLGNMLSLCASNLFPNNAKISLGFSTCLIMSYKRIPSRDLVQSCALEHGIPFEALNDCVSEEGKGLDLLEASIKRSQEAGVKKSCTVRVAEEIWCIMDDGKWTDCKAGHEVKDLVKEIESRYKPNATG